MLATAQGVLGGEIADARTAETRQLADEMMLWSRGIAELKRLFFDSACVEAGLLSREGSRKASATTSTSGIRSRAHAVECLGPGRFGRGTGADLVSTTRVGPRRPLLLRAFHRNFDGGCSGPSRGSAR